MLVAASLVVASAGVTKVRTPGPTASLLRPILGRSAPLAGRTIGFTEVVVGTAALLLGGTLLAGTLAGAYVVFLAVSVLARRADTACGCFGESSTKPDALHLVIVAAGALGALGAAATGTAGLVGLASEGVTGLVTIASASLAGVVAVVALTVVPATRAAAHRPTVRLFDTTDATP